MKFPQNDIAQAEIELAYIEAAILLANAHNDIGCEIHIGQLTIGISINDRILPILLQEKQEIEKFLKGEPNNWQ